MHTETLNNMKPALAAVFLNIFSTVERTDVSFFLSTAVSCLAIVHYVIKIKKEKK